MSGFPILNSAAGPTWTFLGFVVSGVAAITSTWQALPETRGRTLGALENDFRERYA
ncbi:hypothetical protein NGB36_29860 [Streptomyces sp. RB6PN25]|uniref:Uncharacterized protein n=1 Tax=Streptomyces humicola TaxID=2953240 RepID=A0ABT1Q468_9ACTN|nr:hypothetical protein [Streptomyces humicola]MCQ4084669.1 hypothetical protein [Streptomyces humicola]